MPGGPYKTNLAEDYAAMLPSQAGLMQYVQCCECNDKQHSNMHCPEMTAYVTNAENSSDLKLKQRCII